MENIDVVHNKSVGMERQRESEKKRDQPLSSPLYSSLPLLSFHSYPFVMDNVMLFGCGCTKLGERPILDGNLELGLWYGRFLAVFLWFF